MKKYLLILTLISLLLSLCACRSNKKTNDSQNVNESSTIVENNNTKDSKKSTKKEISRPVENDTSKTTVTDTQKPTTTPTSCLHNYKSEVIKEATCTSTGLIKYTCSKCGNNYTETIQKKEHTSVIDSAVEATCKHTGLSEGSHCAVCGEILIAQKEIAKKEHIKTLGTTVKETCTDDGYVIYICSICGQELGKEIIPATGHSFENGLCKKCGALDPNYVPIPPEGNYELPEDEL